MGNVFDVFGRAEDAGPGEPPTPPPPLLPAQRLDESGTEYVALWH